MTLSTIQLSSNDLAYIKLLGVRVIMTVKAIHINPQINSGYYHVTDTNVTVNFHKSTTRLIMLETENLVGFIIDPIDGIGINRISITHKDAVSVKHNNIKYVGDAALALF